MPAHMPEPMQLSGSTVRRQAGRSGVLTRSPAGRAGPGPAGRTSTQLLLVDRRGQAGQPLDQRAERHLQLHPGQLSAEAVVHAVPETEVRAGPRVTSSRSGSSKTVPSRLAEDIDADHRLAGPDPHATELQVLGGVAGEARRRRRAVRTAAAPRRRPAPARAARAARASCSGWVSSTYTKLEIWVTVVSWPAASRPAGELDHLLLGEPVVVLVAGPHQRADAGRRSAPRAAARSARPCTRTGCPGIPRSSRAAATWSRRSPPTRSGTGAGRRRARRAAGRSPAPAAAWRTPRRGRPAGRPRPWRRPARRRSRRVAGRSCSTRRAVKALATRRRRRLWSGGSIAIMPARRLRRGARLVAPDAGGPAEPRVAEHHLDVLVAGGEPGLLAEGQPDPGHRLLPAQLGVERIEVEPVGLAEGIRPRRTDLPGVCHRTLPPSRTIRSTTVCNI